MRVVCVVCVCVCHVCVMCVRVVCVSCVCVSCVPERLERSINEDRSPSSFLPCTPSEPHVRLSPSPQGPFYSRGYYHLFMQYCSKVAAAAAPPAREPTSPPVSKRRTSLFLLDHPQGPCSEGNVQAWAHFTSPDLAQWTEQPVALQPDGEVRRMPQLCRERAPPVTCTEADTSPTPASLAPTRTASTQARPRW